MTWRLGEIFGCEKGSIVVAGGVMMLVFALLGGTVIEVGQWFQHRRNLQVRTDASALAAGQALNACFNIGTTQFPAEQDADSYIEGWAHDYAGVPAASQTRPLYNQRFDKPVPLVSFQSDTFPSSSNLQPVRNLGPECFLDSDPTNTNPSNLNLMTDVRTTQEGISPFFSFSPLATVHGWARVQLQVIKDLKPTMPLAVPDVNPRHVAVTFVDNTTGQALPGCADVGYGACVFPLTGPTNSVTLNAWGGQATLPMPPADANVGMRVSIGSENGSCAGVNATATYTCYDYTDSGGSSPRGILDIRSYNTATVSGVPPILRSVTPMTCVPNNAAGGTPYFSAYQAPGGTCDNVSITADVSFPAGATNQSVTYKITQANCNNPSGQMTQSGTTWTSSLTSLPTATGAYDVCLAWSYKDSSNRNQSGVFGSGNGGPVQQIFSGSDGTDPTNSGGPIMAAAISDPSTGNGVYSLPAGGTATVAVTIGLTGGVHINPKCPQGQAGSGKDYSCSTDPTVVLRTMTQTQNRSHTYAIDCGTIPGHTGGTLAQQIQYGCANSYSINTADLCPDPANPTPPSCVPVQTGAAVGQVQQAFNARFVKNGACAVNNYPDTSDLDDPRIVQLIDTDFSAYIGSGGSTSSDVPVVTFATFYVTGWNGADSSCSQYNEPAPPNAGSNGNSANVWGHFIAFVTNGTPSGIKCDPRALAPCVGALVR